MQPKTLDRSAAATPGKGWLGAWLLMSLVFLVANHALVSGKVSAVRDGARLFCPYYRLVADFAREAHLLVWNPWSGGGVPDFAEPQVGALSPLTVGVAWLTGGTELGFRVYWLLVWWLGGAGMLLFARYLRAPAWGGLVAALGFLFSGMYTSGAPWISCLLGTSALPFVFWRADKAFTERAWRPAFEAGALWGLSSLGGYPELTIGTGSFLAVWGLGRWWSARAPGPSAAGRRGAGLFRHVGVLAVVCATGVLVLAPTYVGFLFELPGFAQRTGALSREAAVSDNCFAPSAFSTLASPFLAVLKGRAQDVLWPETWIEGSSVYLGPVVALLAVWGAVFGRRGRWRAWLVVLALLGFGVAVGHGLPLRGWLYDFFYPFRFFRHASILRIYGMFVLVVLAILGSRDLEPSDSERSPEAIRAAGLRRVCVSASVVLLALAGYWVTLRAFERGVGDSGAPAVASDTGMLGPSGALSALAHLVVTWGMASAALVALWYARNAPHGRARLALVSLGAVAIADGILTIETSAPLMVGTEAAELWQRVGRDHRTELDLIAHGLERVFEPDYLGPEHPPDNEHLLPKIPALECYNALGNPVFGLLLATPAFADLAIGKERLWFAGQATYVAPSLRNALLFAGHVQEHAEFPLLLHEPEALLSMSAPSADEDLADALAELPPAVRLGASSVSAYEPRELAFEVDCPADGWLLVTDRWSRGWRATVDDRPVEIQGGLFLFRAVPVHAGRNAIHFRYDLPWLTTLVVLSWGTLATIGIVAAGAAIRRRRVTAS